MEVIQDVGPIQPLGSGGWIGAYPPGDVSPHEGAHSQGQSQPEASTSTTTTTTPTFASAPAPAPAPALCQNTHNTKNKAELRLF